MQAPDPISIVSSSDRPFTEEEIRGFHAFTQDPEQRSWDPGEEELDLPGLLAFFRERLPARPHQAVFLAKAGHVVVGMGGLFAHRDVEDKGEAQLGFGVLTPWQGKGIARALVDRALDRARSVGLRRIFAEVLPHNLRAIGLLSAAGFEIVTPTQPEPSAVAVFALRF
ncbi:MAG: GNAT family N-acetyltransferase [Planctomycetota bacterium]